MMKVKAGFVYQSLLMLLLLVMMMPTCQFYCHQLPLYILRMLRPSSFPPRTYPAWALYLNACQSPVYISAYNEVIAPYSFSVDFSINYFAFVSSHVKAEVRGYDYLGLTWGLDFNPHTHRKTMGILTHPHTHHRTEELCVFSFNTYFSVFNLLYTIRVYCINN